VRERQGRLAEEGERAIEPREHHLLRVADEVLSQDGEGDGLAEATEAAAGTLAQEPPELTPSRAEDPDLPQGQEEGP